MENEKSDPPPRTRHVTVVYFSIENEVRLELEFI
jgi:hypothetical protein